MKKFSLLIFLVLCFIVNFADAKPSKQKEQKPKLTAEEQKLLEQYQAKTDEEKKLDYKTGSVTLSNNLATLNLPADYRFLDAAQSKKVLTEFWGNPPSESTVLGMIVPAEISLLDPESWAVVITYTEDGHVEDNDAESINYTDLLKQMQDEMREANADRTKQGFASIELVDWAAAPRYDKATHKLFWAKNLKFSDVPDENTLNYDVRVLGRKGVLSLNAVSGMGKVTEIEQKMSALLPAVEFTSGNRYDDFDSNVDTYAAYGIGALVAGNIAAKAGLFKGLIALLIAGKKLVVVAVVAVGGFLSRLFFGKKD